VKATPLWIPADWSVSDNILAGCTTRIGGVSDGTFEALNLGAHVGDNPDAVKENRRRLAVEIELPGEPVWLKQVHGANVVVNPAGEPEADASVTSEAGFVCAVMIADCLPVLFAADDGSEVAAAHAGWRGLAAGVLENTINALSASPDQVHAWLGPAISQAAFEVGAEVQEAFLATDDGAVDCFTRNAAGRWQADLYALARRRLASAGVSRVSGGDFCTYADRQRFFSYRRDGQCGRMAAIVCRRH
jgi:YfiH family protein